MSLLFFLAATGVASGQGLNRWGKSFPDISLSSVSSGANITTNLGTRLQEVSDWYGQTADDFTKVVKAEKDIRADKKARLHYACTGLIPPSQTTGVYGTQTPGVAAYPLVQTFLLHSRPNSTRKIYLDFTGHTTSGTAWNTTYTAGADIVTPPYDIDGNTSAFSDQELANIQQIWQQVSEDYSAFNVDVTTEDPGVGALTMADASDPAFGKRVVVGGSSATWLGSSAGGIAYVGSFTWPVDTPAFIFPVELANGDPKAVAEACAHETGHTLGLHHDGTTAGIAYYQGTSNWAPIMGLGYYVNVVQWSKGEYPQANNLEDDVAMIAQSLGYVTDEAGSDAAHAFLLAGTAPQAYGVIHAPTDLDVYAFNAGAGAASFTLSGAAPSPNLCVQLTLRDKNGATVQASTPSLMMGGSIVTTLTKGSYYLEVKSAGVGDWSNGFNSYGSVGQYLLAASVVSPGSPPVAVVSNSTSLTGVAPLTTAFSSTGSSAPSGTIASYLWDFGDGTTSTVASPSHVYSTAGSYVANLTITDNAGLIGKAATTVLVKTNQPPLASAAASPLQGTAPLTVALSSAGSSDPEGSALVYLWDFGDGTTSTVASPSHSYTVAGSFVAKLTVKDSAGLSSQPASTATISVVAPNQAPVAKAAATPTSVSATVAVAFSSTGSSDPEGGALTYLWDFGDSTTSTVASPSHAYATAGTYVAKLMVTDNKGLASAAASVTITVTAPNLPPIVKATATPSTQYVSTAVAFSSTGTSDPEKGTLTYLWSFGDGTTSTAANPSKTYASAGTFTATLKVTDNKGASTSTSLVIIVVAKKVYVADVVVSLVTSSSTSWGATAKVTVKDAAGALKGGVTVTGTWSGVYAKTGATAATGTSGTALGVGTFTATSSTKKGTYTFTVTGLTLSGFTYDTTKNVKTSGAVSTPL